MRKIPINKSTSKGEFIDEPLQFNCYGKLEDIYAEVGGLYDLSINITELNGGTITVATKRFKSDNYITKQTISATGTYDIMLSEVDDVHLQISSDNVFTALVGEIHLKKKIVETQLGSASDLPSDPSVLPDGTRYVLDELVANQGGDCCVQVVVKDGLYKLVKPTVVCLETNLTHQVISAEIGTEITLATIDIPSALLNTYIKAEGLFVKDITTTGITSINVRASGYGIIWDTIQATSNNTWCIGIETFRYDDTLGYKYTNSTSKSGVLVEKPFQASIGNANQVSLTISVNDEMYIDLKSFSLILK